MTEELIKTENYLLVVSDEVINEGVVISKSSLDEYVVIFHYSRLNFYKLNTSKDSYQKIIAHLPLNGAPYLDGVDVLPEIEDDINNRLGEACDLLLSMLSEYPPSKEFVDERIRCLNQPKLPIAFERTICESCNGDGFTAEHDPNDPHDFGCSGSCPIQVQCDNCYAVGYKTITNSEGRTEWFGKYIYYADKNN